MQPPERAHFSHQIQADIEKLLQFRYDRILADKLGLPAEKMEKIEQDIQELKAAIEVRLAVMKEVEKEKEGK